MSDRLPKTLDEMEQRYHEESAARGWRSAYVENIPRSERVKAIESATARGVCLEHDLPARWNGDLCLCLVQ